MEVTINNKTSLDLLNNTLDTLHSLMEKYEVDPYDPNQHLISPGLEDWDDVEKTIQCTTEEFLKTNHWNNYNDHIGYPVEFRAYPIEHMSAKSQEFYDFWAYLKYEMPAELGATANALCAYYPNNGLTGWHTNWNANAYQFLFTWLRSIWTVPLIDYCKRMFDTSAFQIDGPDVVCEDAMIFHPNRK